MPTIGRYLEAPPRRSQRLRGSLVLIHAFPLNARMWEPQLELADAGWRVIAPQLRGMDGGAADPPATSIDDFAADVIDLLDALHIDDAVIGGLSMGGYVAFALFRHAPRYFRGLVLADTRSHQLTFDVGLVGGEKQGSADLDIALPSRAAPLVGVWWRANHRLELAAGRRAAAARRLWESLRYRPRLDVLALLALTLLPPGLFRAGVAGRRVLRGFRQALATLL